MRVGSIISCIVLFAFARTCWAQTTTTAGPATTQDAASAALQALLRDKRGLELSTRAGSAAQRFYFQGWVEHRNAGVGSRLWVGRSGDKAVLWIYNDGGRTNSMMCGGLFIAPDPEKNGGLAIQPEMPWRFTFSASPDPANRTLDFAYGPVPDAKGQSILLDLASVLALRPADAPIRFNGPNRLMIQDKHSETMLVLAPPEAAFPIRSFTMVSDQGLRLTLFNFHLNEEPPIRLFDITKADVEALGAPLRIVAPEGLDAFNQRLREVKLANLPESLAVLDKLAKPDAAADRRMQPVVLPLTFPAGQRGVKVKLERAGDGLFTRELRINGEEVGLLLIDTGATTSILDRTVARRLSLPVLGKVEASVAGGSIPIARTDSVSLGGVTIRDLRIGILDLRGFRDDSGIQLVGRIGGDVWARLPFTIDYRESTLTLHDPAQFSPPAEAQAVDMAVRGFPSTRPTDAEKPVVGGYPVVPGRVDQVDCRILLDTGATGGLILAARTVEKHPEWVNLRGPRMRKGIQLSVFGPRLPARIEAVTILGQRFDNPSQVSADTRPANGREAQDPVPYDATAGTQLLQHFRLTFDYEHGTLWVRRQQLPSVKDQLKAGLNVNRRDLAGLTPLMDAAAHGDAEGCQALIEAGARLDATSPSGWTVLHFAAEGGDPALLDLLLKQKDALRINIAANSGVTTLMVAACEHAQLVPPLLAAGAKPTQFDNNGLTALHWAVRYNNAAAVDPLVTGGASVDAVTLAGSTALLGAAECDAVETYDALLRHAPTIRRGNDQRTALHCAAVGGSPRMVRHLLKDYPGEFDVNARDRDGATALMLAAHSGSVGATQALLDAGADVNVAAEGMKGLSAMHYAASAGHAGIITLLLRHKATLEARGANGQTPLMFAASLGHVEAVKTLLDAGAKVDTTSDDRMTALHVAAFNGQADVIPVLLRAGAALEARAREGLTPLWWACHKGHVEATGALLAAGAEPNAKNDAGKMPEDAARARGFTEIVQLLKQAKQSQTTRPATSPLP